jgi:hypothetical protein
MEDKMETYRLGNKSFKTVEPFIYFGTSLMYQNSIHEEIKIRLKSENAYYHTMQNVIQKYKD